MLHLEPNAFTSRLGFFKSFVCLFVFVLCHFMWFVIFIINADPHSTSVSFSRTWICIHEALNSEAKIISWLWSGHLDLSLHHNHKTLNNFTTAGCVNTHRFSAFVFLLFFFSSIILYFSFLIWFLSSLNFFFICFVFTLSFTFTIYKALIILKYEHAGAYIIIIILIKARWQHRFSWLSWAISPEHFYPISWGCRIHRLQLCRGVSHPHRPMNVLVMTLNNLMVRFQWCWSFRECWVLLLCHRSQV